MKLECSRLPMSALKFPLAAALAAGAFSLEAVTIHRSFVNGYPAAAAAASGRVVRQGGAVLKTSSQATAAAAGKVVVKRVVMCAARSKTGARCKSKAVDGGIYCAQHAKIAEQKKKQAAAARE